MKMLINESINEMMNFPGRDIRKEIKDVIKNILKRPVYKTERDCVGWPNALCALGLVEYINVDSVMESRILDMAEGDQKFSYFRSGRDIAEGYLLDYFDRWVEEGAEIKKLEDLLSGYVFLKLADYFAEDREECERFDEAAELMYEYVKKAVTDGEGVFIYNQNRPEKIVLADMLGMVCPFLAKYASKNMSAEALELCLNQFEGFLKVSNDKKTGLVWHGYLEDAVQNSKDNAEYKRIGILGWGRAEGWMLLGLAVLFEESSKMKDILDSEIKGRIASLHKYFVDTSDIILDMYAKDKADLLRWNLTENNAHVDSSFTAMFVYAYKKTLGNGNESIDSMCKALQKRIKPNGKVTDGLAECLGAGVYPQKFGSYPWSVGMTLAALICL